MHFYTKSNTILKTRMIALKHIKTKVICEKWPDPPYLHYLCKILSISNRVYKYNIILLIVCITCIADCHEGPGSSFHTTGISGCGCIYVGCWEDPGSSEDGWSGSVGV